MHIIQPQQEHGRAHRRGIRGQGLSEYLLIVGLIGVITLIGLSRMGASVQGSSTRIGDAITPPSGGDPEPVTATRGPGPALTSGDFNWRHVAGRWSSGGDGRHRSDQWSIAVADVPGPNYKLSMQLRTTRVAGPDTRNVTRVVFRFQDPHNFYAIVPRTDGGVELAKMQDGKWRPWLSYANIGNDPQKYHQYTVHAVGRHIQVAVDGVSCIDYADPDPVRNGGIGAADSGSNGNFQNVSVEME